MPHGDAVEGHVLAALAVDGFRQSTSRSYRRCRSRLRRRHEVIHLKSDAAESYVAQIGGGKQAAAQWGYRLKLGDHNGIGIRILTAVGKVVQRPWGSGAIQKPEAGLTGGAGRLERIPGILDDVAVARCGSEVVVLVGKSPGRSSEVNDVLGSIDTAYSEYVDCPGIEYIDFYVAFRIAVCRSSADAAAGIKISPCSDRVRRVVIKAIKALGPGVILGIRDAWAPGAVGRGCVPRVVLIRRKVPRLHSEALTTCLVWVL